MLKIVFHSLLNRKKILLLVLFSLSLSSLLFLGVHRIKELSRSSFSRTISGTDLIIGARTGRVNLILYSVFHMGNAVNNMGYETYQEISTDDRVDWCVPLSLGDSHRGFRVVGTTTEYFEHFTYGGKKKLAFQTGICFNNPFGVVVGSLVARELNYRKGDKIIVSHGSGKNTIDHHDTMPFHITGILQSTGTPVDRSLIVPLEGITAIHLGWEHGIKTVELTHEQAETMDLTPKAITAALIGLKNRSDAFKFQRQINTLKKEPIMAIFPGAALYELWSIMGAAEKALTFISVAVILIGLLSLLTTQIAILDQRRREMALLRSLGATPVSLFFILFIESFVMTLVGCLTGLILLYVVLFVSIKTFAANGLFIELTLPSLVEFQLLGSIVIAGVLAGIIPAFLAYRKSLSDGLTIRN